MIMLTACGLHFLVIRTSFASFLLRLMTRSKFSAKASSLRDGLPGLDPLADFFFVGFSLRGRCILIGFDTVAFCSSESGILALKYRVSAWFFSSAHIS